MLPIRHTLLTITTALALTASSFAAAQVATPPAPAHSLAANPALFAYGTIDALLAGAYDGTLSVAELTAQGNFGLGTFNRLDGEMIVLNGIVYHARADGSVSVATATERSPLAYVVPFEPGESFVIDTSPGIAMADIEQQLDARLPNKNLFFAVRVQGQFAQVTTRAIAPQTRPYRPLAEVAKEQKLFTRAQVTGSLVGLRSPAFAKGISVPGWHWHFLSEDTRYGGHVLAGTLLKGRVSVATVRELTVRLPDTEDFAQADQSKDRAVELHQVESDRR